MKHGQRIVLRGEAGCTEPGLTPGDVVLVVQQKPHDTFKRIQQANPADLLLEKTISLKEALCGCSFSVQHLDGRTLHIKTNEGQVIKPNSFMVVQSEGMPVHGRPFVKGNLYVRFEVSWGQAAAGGGCSMLWVVLTSVCCLGAGTLILGQEVQWRFSNADSTKGSAAEHPSNQHFLLQPPCLA
jgi:DnaJ family protein A protein 2